MSKSRCLGCVFATACEDVEAIAGGGALCYDFVSDRSSLGRAIGDEYGRRLEDARKWLLGAKEGEAR